MSVVTAREVCCAAQRIATENLVPCCELSRRPPLGQLWTLYVYSPYFLRRSLWYLTCIQGYSSATTARTTSFMWLSNHGVIMVKCLTQEHNMLVPAGLEPTTLYETVPLSSVPHVPTLIPIKVNSWPLDFSLIYIGFSQGVRCSTKNRMSLYKCKILNTCTLATLLFHAVKNIATSHRNKRKDWYKSQT